MNNKRDLFTGNLTAEPELNYPPKGTAVVNASLANLAKVFGGLARFFLKKATQLKPPIVGDV
jgi:hypothetical protein